MVRRFLKLEAENRADDAILMHLSVAAGMGSKDAAAKLRVAIKRLEGSEVLIGKQALYDKVEKESKK